MKVSLCLWGFCLLDPQERVVPMRIMLLNVAKMVQDSGGLSKVTCAFANEMERRGHEVSLVYSDDRQGETFFPLSSAVRAYNLRHYGGQQHTFPLHLKIKREVMRAVDQRRGRAVNNQFTRENLIAPLRAILTKEEPEVIVASQPAGAEAALVDAGTKTPVICMSHGDPEDYFHTYPPEEISALKRCACCQVLLPSFAEHLNSHLPDMRTVVIGNVVPQYEMKNDMSVPKSRYKIIFLGRLVRNHKRPHLLIRAFARLADKFPAWDVELWGAEDRKSYTRELKNLIRKHGLNDRIRFCGTTSDVESVYRSGDVFAFPSAYEGFGLTLAEAMSMGLPAVGYRNCSAVNELIRDDENGLLCEDGDQALAESLARLMRDPGLRSRLGKQAHLDMQAYAAEGIWESWESLLQSVSNER